MTRDSENWEELQKLFHLAEAKPETELDAVLLAACDNPELRRRARALIVAARINPEASTPSGAPLLKGRIGPYTTVRHLGSGGIGAVYLVERIVGGTVQRAALKVLSLHAAGNFFVERFAREQHILASLDHPNITRMLDAGLNENGEPYLVMEYVDGTHLDAYCDQRSLSVQDRLKLYLHVCDAVAYAHRNLVVHLDLKPSNILVTDADGTVKLLDFGTSKLIQPDSLLTTTVMATPAYASPEQLRNEAVTTSCDIYALGAILFELLAGRRPNLDSSVAIMIERSIKELPPEPLPEAVTGVAAQHRGLTQTRLRSLLSGDLATIVAKCLSPRPRDRYASVDALITDIQRYLDGRPIFARPQTTTYRIGKFIRRNRMSVAAGVLAVLAITATSGYALWRQEQAVREGRRAQQMQNFMHQLFRLANSEHTGKPAATVPELLALGVRVLPDFIKDPADLRAAQLNLAESMVSDSDYKDATPLLSQVISESKAYGDKATEAEAEGYAGKVAYTLGDTTQGKVLAAQALSLAHAHGVTPSARVHIESFFARNQEDEGFRTDENIRLMEAAVQEAHTAHLPDDEVAEAELNLAEALGPRGRLQDEEHLTQDALAIYTREPYAICDQAAADGLLALIHNQLQDAQGSLNLMQAAYAGYKSCAGEDSLKALETQSYMAAAMLRAGQYKAVIPMLEAALPRWEKVAGKDSDELSAPLLFLTRAYIQDAQFAKATATAANLVRVEQGKINPLSAQMGVCQMVWAQALAGQDLYREALPHAQMADKAFATENSKSPGTRNNAAKAHALLLDIQSKLAS